MEEEGIGIGKGRDNDGGYNRSYVYIAPLVRSGEIAGRKKEQLSIYSERGGNGLCMRSC